MEEKRERRRNCADRARAALMTKKIHRRRRVDPALSVAIQLLAIVSVIIGMFSAPAVAEPLPEAPKVKPLAAPLADPVLREYRRGRPSWTQVFRDLESSRRHEARNAIYQAFAARSPEVKLWLDELDRNGDLKGLRPYALRPGATDDEIGAAISAAAKQWQADKAAPDDCGDDFDGDGKAGSGSKPGGGRKPGK